MRFPIRINGKECERWEDEPSLHNFKWFIWIFGLTMGIVEFSLYKHESYGTLRTVALVTVGLWLFVSLISLWDCCSKKPKDGRDDQPRQDS